jgi:hypothetical protein
MSNNERSSLPIGLAKQRRNDKQRRKPDLRIRRTRSLLSNALVALMQEKSIDKITVQEVLDCATVGRSTFYLHRDKDDPFLCVLSRESASCAAKIPAPSAATVQATVAYCDYVFRHYGWFPAYTAPFRTVIGFQVSA